MSERSEEKIGNLLNTLGQTARIQILLAIGEDEACVCHLEILLGLRQAYISQHLMALRNAGILTTRRDGRFIFYQIKDRHLLDLIKVTAKIVGVDDEEINSLLKHQPIPQCCCPDCVAQLKHSLSNTKNPFNLIPPNKITN